MNKFLSKTIIIKLFLTLLIILISKISLAEFVKPNSTILPEEVILLQLKALQKNNIPFKDAGIEQAWEFAHPHNRKFTGPLSNFISMMHNPSYAIILDHMEHNIIKIGNNDLQTFFFVELINYQGTKVGFKWILEKVLEEGKYKNCWMTTSVSNPIQLSKSI